jgi:hypothetical protein
LLLFLAPLLALGALARAPMAHALACSDPCLVAARAELRECTSSATGAFHDARDGCLEKAHDCVQACRSVRQECRDATDLGAELARCDLQLEVDQKRCTDRFPLVPKRSRQARAICIFRAQTKNFRCRSEARRHFVGALADCQRNFRACTGACGPGQPPLGTRACKQAGKTAFDAVVADCRLIFQATSAACVNKDPICIQDCAAARAACAAPTQATLEGALAACKTQVTQALVVCQMTNPGGGAPLQQCVTEAQANAATCADAALGAAAPGVAACVPPYVHCVRACPPA